MANQRKRGNHPLSRRQFLQVSGAAATAGMLASMGGCESGGISGASANIGAGSPIELLADFKDPVVATPQAQWALQRLSQALMKAGAPLLVHNEIQGKPALTLMVAGRESPMVASTVKVEDIPTAPESLALVPFKREGRPALLAAAADGNGLSYALTELADRIEMGANPYASLMPAKAIVKRPANKVRSVMRSFGSEEEDKPWYYDLEGWKRYFDILAINRFNKFNLALGLAYDFSDRVVDGYFYNAYPFFLKVPGYNVRAIARDGKPLSDEEQDKNLKTLQFISKEATARGIHFQLGLWTHSIKWPLTQGVTANYTLDGISTPIQANYSRDAMRLLLNSCPDIKGVTIRTHGESGVPEGDNLGFWKTIFEGTTGLAGGRKVQVDLHAKGITFEIIDAARATGNPVIVTPKFWAEHMGLPYMQASIREWELPKAQDTNNAVMSRSTGTRNHMRYGYGDILTKDRQYGIVHRIFPGTQRFLVWGDPLFAREYGKQFAFNGSDGVELMEQLTFKGRQGSRATTKNRSAYADDQLKPKETDQKDKYEYTYRLWGRMTYNPDADADVYQRLLRRDAGADAASIEKALGAGARAMPLVTVAHSPSAAQANFWPELYYNMSHHDANAPTYGDDTPAPKVFGTVTSLDPHLFASCDESAVALVAGKGLGKISPSEVADQLDAWAVTALAGADKKNTGASVQSQRMRMDATLTGLMAQFWAAKFRTGLFYSIFDKTGHEPAREAALAAYQQARKAMAAAAETGNVYIRDITFGADKKLRGHWSERLTHIDSDIAGMKTARPRATIAEQQQAAAALGKALKKMERPQLAANHTAQKSFKAGDVIPVRLSLQAARNASVKLWYRHVNQAELYQSVMMDSRGDTFEATIPGTYTKSPYGMQYYFEISPTPALTGLFPAFGKDFTGTPYFFVMQA